MEDVTMPAAIAVSLLAVDADGSANRTQRKNDWSGGILGVTSEKKEQLANEP
jgi:hypothetical protein